MIEYKWCVEEKFPNTDWRLSEVNVIFENFFLGTPSIVRTKDEAELLKRYFERTGDDREYRVKELEEAVKL